MLYVFQVDTGMMMTFEMRLAMDKVANLKKAIAAKTDIPENKQVLLISGGESLNSMQRVCSYSSAGTDTSPIFLFAKINIESNQPPMPNIDYGDDTDMTEMIESCMSMQPSLDTLVARTELAAVLNEQAIKQKEVCERLVHDQHIQQQGWAAVTANLEDLSRAFKNKAEMLVNAFGDFIKCKPQNEDLLNKFGEDIKHLDKIPILPVLVENNKPISHMQASNTNYSPGINSPKATSITDMDKDRIDSTPKGDKHDRKAVHTKRITDEDAQTSAKSIELEASQKVGSAVDEKSDAEKITLSLQQQGSSISDESLITLRQWIDFHDTNNGLDRLIELCWRGLNRFTEANAEQIRHDVQELLKLTNNTSMKEIKGLEERLFGLEKLMVDANKVVDEQCQLASSFQSNRERFSKIKDSTLLPDLSASHKQQLQMMLINHKKMSDYRNRCVKAKHELSVNLHARLKWIMYIEQQISDLDGKLMIYKENLLRLNRHLEIVDQVHKSPDLYLAAVVEALRRRRFARRYLHWASSIAKISQEIHENEMAARKAFDSKLGNHFLSSMFPGLTRSYPPPFAMIQPDPFDTKLPRITAADIQYLQANLSDELAEKLHIPKDVPMPHIISAPNPCDDSIQADAEDLDDRHSLNPTPPSSPTRPQQFDD